MKTVRLFLSGMAALSAFGLLAAFLFAAQAASAAISVDLAASPNNLAKATPQGWAATPYGWAASPPVTAHGRPLPARQPGRRLHRLPAAPGGPFALRFCRPPLGCGRLPPLRDTRPG